MPQAKKKKATKIKIKRIKITKAKKLNNNPITAVILCLFNP